MPGTFEPRRKAVAAQTEAALDRVLSSAPEVGEAGRPERLVAAMRYAALGGGKRIRPFLLVESARLNGAPEETAVMAAAALECVHAYSLVHDDLPAMDDDDLRRGRPTVHRAFDEPTAILAGDALLTIAFDVLAGLDAPDAVRVRLVAAMARASGVGGMAGGQMLDLAAGSAWSEATLRAMQRMKTGALFAYACEAGAILADADAAARASLRGFGQHFGAAFQLADDIDDREGDDASGRPSLAVLLGDHGARTMLRAETAAAAACLAAYGPAADPLRAALRFVAGDALS